MATAAEVPSKYDCVINGEGYRFLETEERAAYALTPTFVARQNVQGNYGDNQQDFWLTYSQNDWSLGEGQKFYRADDEERTRRYDSATALEVTTAGVARSHKNISSVTTTGASFHAMTTRSAVNDYLYVASTSVLYSLLLTPTASSEGAHGLGAAPSRFGMCSDGSDIYMTTTSAGTVGVRKWDGSSFTTFSSGSPADSLTFLNNTLYGLRYDNAKLVSYSTSGAQTDIFQWKQADGDARTITGGKVVPFGGKLLIMFPEGPAGGCELWEYNGVAPALLARFPDNFYATDMDVLLGTVFVGGFYVRCLGAVQLEVREAVFYYASGSIGTLWEYVGNERDSTSTNDWVSANQTALSSYTKRVNVVPFESRLMFNDVRSNGNVYAYDAVEGSVHHVGLSATGGPTRMAASRTYVAMTLSTTSIYYWPAITYNTQPELYTSQIDFDSSLTKYFKSVKVDYDNKPVSAGAVGISYQLNGAGSYTSVTSDAATGTEYSIGQSGRTIRLKVTLGSSASAVSANLKRVYLRAAPVLDQFDRREYILDLSGVDGESPLQLRDGTPHTKDGHQMAQDLITAMQATTPITITDRFGTFTGLIEPDGSQIIETRPGVYRATIRVREV